VLEDCSLGAARLLAISLVVSRVNPPASINRWAASRICLRVLRAFLDILFWFMATGSAHLRQRLPIVLRLAE
jgi:hypothetical protein